MKVTVETALHAVTSATDIDIPDIKSWDEIESWYIKWDTLHYRVKGSAEDHEIELNTCADDIIDWKHPISTTVMDADGCNVLDEV